MEEISIYHFILFVGNGNGHNGHIFVFSSIYLILPLAQKWRWVEEGKYLNSKIEIRKY